MELIIYGIYTFLAAYTAGNMTTLQLQHYNLYPFVGKENFEVYMRANNKAALFPSVIPGTFLLVLSLVLMFYRPGFMTLNWAIISLLLNITAFISTFAWQRKLQGDMARGGYDNTKIKLLLSTNWIRTIAFIILGVLMVYLLVSAVEK